MSATRGDEHVHTAVLTLNLANALRQSGKANEAKELLESVRLVFVDLVGSEHEFVARTDFEILVIAQMRGNDINDETLTSIMGRIEKTNDFEIIAESHFLAAKVMLDRGSRSQARIAIDRALSVSRSANSKLQENAFSEWARDVKLR